MRLCLKKSLGVILIVKNARIYLGHSRSLALILRPPHIRIRVLLDTASSVMGGRSYWCTLIDMDWQGDIFVAFCQELVGYVDA